MSNIMIMTMFIETAFCSRIDGDYCENSRFFCTDQVKECDLDCNGVSSCKNTKVYSSAQITTVGCQNHNACPAAGINIYCLSDIHKHEQ